MVIDVDLGEAEDSPEAEPTAKPSVDPEEFFAKNAFRLVYQTNNFFLPQIRDLIDKGEVINIRPEYQRRLRWSALQKSKLIESLLLNIPIPPVFLYESEAARYEVMDGQQRLNTVREFIAGEFELSGLPVLAPLKGLSYKSCPPRIKRALDRSTLSAIVLLLESETEKSQKGEFGLADVRRFIFDRLNTGGTKLNEQEIRNALNPGVFSQLIIELTRFRKFTDAFEIPAYTEADPNDYYENPDRQKNALYSSMADCQLILRYFALKDEANIRGSMKTMLDRAMKTKITKEEAATLKREYEERFSFLFDLFDQKPFRLPADEKGRERISAAIYDSSMVAINDLWGRREEIKADNTKVKSRMAKATSDAKAAPILTGRANTAQAVKDRIELMRGILTG